MRELPIVYKNGYWKFLQPVLFLTSEDFLIGKDALKYKRLARKPAQGDQKSEVKLFSNN